MKHAATRVIVVFGMAALASGLPPPSSAQAAAEEPAHAVDHLPVLPPEQYAVTLQRDSCLGRCPVYTVEIRGDGHVRYVGEGNVDLEGTHSYQVPVADIAPVLRRLRAQELWAANPQYAAEITDVPTYTVTIRAGDRVHQIVDYAGHLAGMPQTITAFEEEIDQAAGVQFWIHLSSESIERLARQHFDFASDAGTALLWRMVEQGGDHGDALALQLLQRGARADAPTPPNVWDPKRRLIESALINRRAGTVDWLIGHGALRKNGQRDQASIDRAFRAAVRGGLLAGVERIWSAAGDTPPALQTSEEAHPANRIPVTLMLERRGDDTLWEGLAIARWLAQRGCDLQAATSDGRTLLHVAASAGDVPFVRYLLDHGLRVAPSGTTTEPELFVASDEAVALLLLEAGADTTARSKHGETLPAFAASKRWTQVLARLNAHGS